MGGRRARKRRQAVTKPRESQPIQPEVLPAPTSIESLHLVDTAALRRELARAIRATAESLSYLAAVWRELEERGEDLSDLRYGLGLYLGEIAAGRLDPELVVQFARAPTILRLLGGLPIPRQRRIAAGEVIKVADGIDSDTGSPVIVALPASQLSTSQVRLAVGAGKLRSVAEQQRILEATGAATAPQEAGSEGEGRR